MNRMTEMVYVYAGFLLTAAAMYFLLIFPTQWLKVERVRCDQRLGIKVLQISDLHVEKLRIRPGRICRVIHEEQPDLLVLTGDFTRRAVHLNKVRRYAEAIGSHGIPTFAVLGNHDHRLRREELQKLVEILEQAGIRVLCNESVNAGSFYIVGIDDYDSRKSRVSQAFRHVTDRTKPVLVLTHDPNLVLAMKRKYTYLMAGHFHGMQFNVPFLFRFIDKGPLAASGIYKGLHTGEGGMFYISRGIGQAGPNARFLIRSEVNVHEL
ncbi:metallophosphoesterase [Paenibacillus lutrae]|nr:metallophosphoesterase [Paenibacillus lutrae]